MTLKKYNAKIYALKEDNANTEWLNKCTRNYRMVK